MDEKQLKTSLWQRIIIIVVAILLLGSTVLTYMFIVMSGNASKQNAQERLEQAQNAYDTRLAEYETIAQDFGAQYYNTLRDYEKTYVKAFNAANVNNAEKLQTTDLKVGTGRELKEGDTDYMSYYVAWCPDGSLLDASYRYANDEDKEAKENPIGITTPFMGSTNVIEGWKQGIIGMKLGGIRQITMPGELAYGDTVGDKYCGMSNAPLKYIVIALDPNSDEEMKAAYDALITAAVELQLAAQGQA